MFELPRSVSRLAGAAVLGFTLVAAPTVTALSTQAQSVAEPACAGSESVVDGRPTCVPEPSAPRVPSPAVGSADSQQHDGGHH
ncbi:hypothetical protein DQP55_01180 [Mycolicibacterium sp. GF69]|nr:hypothetical protein DQP55_01180 [Mycolicibacterium sp. GF69]